MVVQMQLDLKKKLEILSDAAKYDVACTSSGVDRGGKRALLGIPLCRESATAFPLTAVVSPC